MKFISASDTHFRADYQQNGRFKTSAIAVMLLCSAIVLLFRSISSAEVIDRVVAYVDDTAITLSEFRESRVKMKESVDSITDEEVINSMINRILLLKEAKKMRLEAANADDTIAYYIDIKIKSSIIIREDVILKFYNENISEFGSMDYLSVREEIEAYLVELETNKQIKKHLEELRKNADIVMQLRTDT